MELSGAHIVLECLKEQGVDTIFGYPGGAVIPLYDALYDNKEHFLHVRTSHEQGAAHAADGYARSSGKVGVCIATSGPGATNTVTGIATAYMDSIPMVVITGQVASGLLGKDSFQEVDITGITLPITKHSFCIKDIEKIPGAIREAFTIASSGRPGPVLVDITKDALMAKGPYERQEKSEKQPKGEPLDRTACIEAARLINEAQRPVIYAGGGVSYSEGTYQLLNLAVKGDIPVVNTLMGLGGFPRTHRLSLGLVGMHGLPESNMTVTKSDLVIAVGSRFSDRVIGAVNAFAPNAKVIHIDIDRGEVGKNKAVEMSIIGDVRGILQELASHMIQKNRKDWHQEIDGWRYEFQASGQKMYAKQILDCTWEKLKGDAIVTTEVGQHQMWTAQHWKFEMPRTFITSGGLGTMGFGLGAAIGAQVANPDRRILHIAGDGSFRMNCNELVTVATYKLPIITLLFNNHTLGMVRQWQHLFNNGRYSETDIEDNVDYMKLVEAYGLRGRKVDTIKDFELALEEALADGKGMVIECMLDQDESVYPIVPPGQPIQDYILE
jgi:acetolactate synthase-1/2/3 large subunit